MSAETLAGPVADLRSDVARRIMELIIQTLPADRRSEGFDGSSLLKEEVFVDSILVIVFLGKVKDRFEVDLIERLDALVSVTTIDELNAFMFDLLHGAPRDAAS